MDLGLSLLTLIVDKDGLGADEYVGIRRHVVKCSKLDCINLQ